VGQTREIVAGDAPSGRSAKDLVWVHAARSLCDTAMRELSEAECQAVERPLEAALATAFERLDRLEGSGAEPLGQSDLIEKLASHARLYAAALSYVDMLYARSQRRAPRGSDLLDRALAVRQTLRDEVRALKEENLLTEEACIPKRRGVDAKAVGVELVELIRFCEGTLMFLSPEEWKLNVELFDAELLAQQLLTSVGAHDAPPLLRKIKDDRRRAYTLFMRKWTELRAAAIAELGEAAGSLAVPALD
jgi:hypothetical protein